MDNLPDEILIQILSYLNARDITSFQQTCQHYLHPARDSGFWKLRCSDESRFASGRRRMQQMLSQPANLVALREAVTASNTTSFAGTAGEEEERVGNMRISTDKDSNRAERKAAIACWDPSFPMEQVDFYREYIHRHAKTHIDWLDTSDPSNSDIMGFAALREVDESVRRLLTARDDGSVQIWDVAAYGGRMLSTSAPGVLASSTSYRDKETGAIENMSVDHRQNKAYIAVSDELHEIDLNTLQATKKQPFPFPITVLSEATHPLPITVGTNNTLHLYDPRVSYFQPADTSSRLELLNGTTVASPSSNVLPGIAKYAAHVTLEQPGPTSIVHPFSNSSTDFTNPIYIAGRFTSILAYDRRTWPRIAGTIFSGARLSSMAVLPYPYMPHSASTFSHLPTLSPANLDVLKSAPGFTLIAGGVYGGKGSLELYDVRPSPPVREVFRPSPNNRPTENCYRNRQTAARSRLISVANHGTSIVFSDGDGNVKWVERNGSTVIRETSVVVPPMGSQSGSSSSLPIGSGTREQTREEYDNAEDQPEANDDIIQKLLPIRLASHTSSQPDDLLLYSSSGRIGVMGFGRRTLTNALSIDYSSSRANRLSSRSVGLGDDNDEFHDARTPEELAEQEEERSKEVEERKFSRMMRKALERQAEEVRWMQDLGVSYGL
jgi:hypothetical protein